MRRSTHTKKQRKTNEATKNKTISRQNIKKEKKNPAKAFASDNKKKGEEKNPESKSEEQNKKEGIRERGRVTLTPRGHAEKAPPSPPNTKTRLKERRKKAEKLFRDCPEEREGKRGRSVLGLNSC